MIKSFIILILLIALAVVAVLTKPSPADFQAYIRQQQGDKGQVSVKGLWSDYEVESYLKSVTVHNRVLWTTVEKDGQRQYTGAFGHWFKATPSGSTAANPS